MKKTLSFFITAIVMASIAPVAQAKLHTREFSDVAYDHPQYEAIMYLKEKGLISGYDDGTFKPDQAINRAETMKMILGIKGLNVWDVIEYDPDVFDANLKSIGPDLFNPKSFSDLDSSAWYIEYVRSAYNHGLVQGYPDKTMHPEQNVNTVEALKMLLNYTFLMQSENVGSAVVNDLPYTDVDGTAWYAEYVDAGRQFNILIVDNDKIYPDRNLSRGDLAEMIYRTLVTDENGWKKYMDITVKTVFQPESDALIEAKLMVDGQEAGDLFLGNYLYPTIFKVVGSKVFLNYSPTVYGAAPSAYNAGPVSGSAIFDLETKELKQISLNGGVDSIVDTSKDGGTMLVVDYVAPDSRLLLVDTATLEVQTEVYAWKNDWISGVIEVGDASFSPDGGKIAWSETDYAPTADTSDDGDMFPYEFKNCFVKVYDIKTATTTEGAFSNDGVLRVFGWDDSGNIRLITLDKDGNFTGIMNDL